jgi:hypothetical protein
MIYIGQNNQFQVATSSDVAIRYNDRSVLENMHCAEAFSIMKREGHNIFESMTGPLQRELRESIIAMVMATDMKAHFAVVSELQAAVEKKRMKGEWFDDHLLSWFTLLTLLFVVYSKIGSMRHHALIVSWYWSRHYILRI